MVRPGTTKSVLTAAGLVAAVAVTLYPIVIMPMLDSSDWGKLRPDCSEGRHATDLAGWCTTVPVISDQQSRSFARQLRLPSVLLPVSA